MVSPLVAGVLTVIFVLGLRFLRSSQQDDKLGPPSLPHFKPFLGLDVAYRLLQSYKQGRRSVDFWNFHLKYGPTFQTSVLFQTRIFTSDVENLRAIHSKNFHDWGVEPVRLPSWDPLVGPGVMDTDSPQWRKSRDLVQPLFRRGNIANLPSFDDPVNDLIAKIPDDGSTVNLKPLFARLMLDFTMEFLFGVKKTDEKAAQFLVAFQNGTTEMGKRTQLPFLSKLTSDKAFREACLPVQQLADDFIQQAIKRTKENESSTYFLIDELVTLTDDHAYIRAQLLNVFFAAHDTTATLMTNVFFNLARHPEIYASLHKELLQYETLPESVEELRQIRLLWNVVQETSRLNPVVGQSARLALNDTEFPRGGGPDGQSPFRIRKGTAVQMDYYSLHRDTAMFGPDVGDFRPGRWDNLEVGAWDFLPFANGPRICPGQAMAMMHVCYVTAKIVQTYDTMLNNDPVHEYKEGYHVSTTSENGCKVAFSTKS